MTDSLKTQEMVEGPYSVGLVSPILEDVLYKGFSNVGFNNGVDGLRYGNDPVDFLLGKTIREGVESDFDTESFVGKQFTLNFGSRELIARRFDQTVPDGRKVFVLGIEMNNQRQVLTRNTDNHQEIEIKWDPSNPNGYWRIIDGGKHTHDPEGKNAIEYQYVFTNNTNLDGKDADYRVMFLDQEEYNNCIVPERMQRRSGNTYPTNRKIYQLQSASNSVEPSKSSQKKLKTRKGLFGLFR